MYIEINMHAFVSKQLLVYSIHFGMCARQCPSGILLCYWQLRKLNSPQTAAQKAQRQRTSRHSPFCVSASQCFSTIHHAPSNNTSWTHREIPRRRNNRGTSAINCQDLCSNYARRKPYREICTNRAVYKREGRSWHC